MRQYEVVSKYFAWLVDIINPDNERGSYFKVLEKLHMMPFTYFIELDANRFADGVSLRDRFMRELCIPIEDIYVLDGPCSVLEMMVALALRCEEEVMLGTDKENRTSKWFWVMMENMDISAQDDNVYNEEFVELSVRIMLNRGYDAYGYNGGMFKLKHPRRDLRKVDIWYQLMWYLVENESNEGELYGD